MDAWFEFGRVAIVTGGSRGLGKALATELLMRGVRTIVDGRDAQTLEGAARDLRAFGEVLAIAGDVADPEHARALVAAAATFGRLDLLVNNASTLGPLPLAPVGRLSLASLRRTFDVNLLGPIHLIGLALPLMRRSDAAAIVNVTSDAAVEPYPCWGGYGASKAALEHVSRVLAAELGESPIRVLAIDPGDMNTQLHRDAIPDADPAELRDPRDCARALLEAIAAAKAPFARLRLAGAVPA
ncbi:MAG TPA: SDR family oxidoreductase [Candidatus Acidoferrales bacterium]|nr:SDR family oxidoreductase [Candidatus Acidoferrales bacterium]